jgi:solute carrier family 36 (proton-coupled amino acid transporter)
MTASAAAAKPPAAEATTATATHQDDGGEGHGTAMGGAGYGRARVGGGGDDGMLVDVGNMLKAFIGLNFMYVAYAFSKAGMVRGIVGLVVLVLVTEHCCLLLVEVKNAMPAGENGRGGPPPTFADIARFVGGVGMERTINVALVLTQFGYCVGYLIFISQTVHDLVKTARPVWPFIALPLPPLLGLALLRSIRALGPWSLLANAALLAGFVAVVAYIGEHFRWEPSTPSIATFPLFFGQMTAALEGIGLVVPVETSMSNPARFPLVLRIALLVMGAVLMTVGVLGFATFGEDTRSILLLNFGDNPVVSVVKCVLVVGILFTYPLQLVPVIQAVEGWLLAGPALEERGAQELASVNSSWVLGDSEEEGEGGGGGGGGSSADGSFGSDSVGAAARSMHDERESLALGARPLPLPSSTALIESRRETFVRDPRRVVARVAVVLATALTAMLAGASFGLFQSLVGSIGASTLAYTAPSLFHVLVFKDRLTGLQKVKNWAIFCFGVTGSVVGTLTTIWEIGKVHASGAPFTP